VYLSPVFSPVYSCLLLSSVTILLPS